MTTETIAAINALNYAANENLALENAFSNFLGYFDAYRVSREIIDEILETSVKIAVFD